MASWNIAVVGATGQVGSALVELLQESPLQINTIYFVGSDNNEGEIVRFKGKNETIKNITDFNWEQCDFAFFAVNRYIAQKYAPIAADQGCVVIDSSGVFSAESHIPVIVPQINNHVLADYRNANIIAVAHPFIAQALRSIALLLDIEYLSQLHLTNLIPASYFGKQGVNELAGQTARLLNGLPAESELFDKQISFNILPALNDIALTDSVLIEQIQKITNNYQMQISIDSVIVPVFYGFTQLVALSSAMPISIDIDHARSQALAVELQENGSPTPVTEVNQENSDHANIKIAHLRNSSANQEQIQFYSVSDNIRFLGARMLLETLEIIASENI